LQEKANKINMDRWFSFVILSVWYIITMTAHSLQVSAVDTNATTTNGTTIQPINAGDILTSSGEIKVAPSIFAVIAIGVGIFLCFYGYKLFRPTMFLCGFLVGGLIVALIIQYALSASTFVGTASWIGFLVGGIIVGSLVLCMYNVGVTLVGAAAGIILAFNLNTSIAYKIYPENPDVILLVLIVILGLIGAFLAWKLEKPVVIVATSFIGANAVVWGAGYFIGKYPSGADLKQFRFEDIHGDWAYTIPSEWWGYLAAILILFLLGVYIQARKTGKDINHRSTHAISSSTPDHNGYTSTSTPRMENQVSHA
jgi:hypothetical protein